MRCPRRRWFIYVAWFVASGNGALQSGYRIYSETFPWFTPRDQIGLAVNEYARSEIGHDNFVLIQLSFQPNRGRRPAPAYRSPRPTAMETARP